MTSRRRSTLPLLAASLALLVAAGAQAQADHLLLTEVNARSRDQGIYKCTPYVEVANPTAAAIDLSDVYLSTAQDVTLGQFYWSVVTGEGAGGGSGGNFHARFPEGMTIAPGATLVIAISGSTEYLARYERLPDLELFEDGPAPDAVPEMREAFVGSIGVGLGNGGGNTPALATTSESVVLYRWDRASDLVQDLDYVFYGSDTRVRVNKTGQTADGPDAGDEPSVYLDDTPAAAQTPALGQAPTFNRALQRVSFDETDEAATGGNGASGHDETSENLAVTWQDAAQDPPPAPASWFRTAPIVTAIDAPTAVFEGAPVTIVATVLSHDDLAAVAVHYGTGLGETTVAAVAGAGNAWTAQLPAFAAGEVVSWRLTAETTAGATAAYPRGGDTAEITVAEEPDPGEGPAKLIFTEICITPSPGEFVEIHNPNDVDVDLSDYYLTDAIYATGSQFYWRIVEGNPSQVTVGGGLFGDFHARFPDGAVLPAGETVTVALLGSDAFRDYHLVDPDYELFEDGAPDAIPDLREVFTGSNAIDNVDFGFLTNYNVDTGNGEVMVLYHWDGASDLVTDIDVFVWGNGASYRFSKSGVSIDGPDADDTPSSYAAETSAAAIAHVTFGAGVGQSYTRTDPDEGNQSLTGGNGVGGRDELSENWNQTYAAETASPEPPEGGGGGELDQPVKLLLSEICVAPAAGEFVEIHNPNDTAVDLTHYYLTDGVDSPGGRLYWRIVEGTPTAATVGGGQANDFHARFPAGAVLPPGEAITIALVGSGAFRDTYGVQPDYELVEDGATPDLVPQLLEVFSGSNGTADPAEGLLADQSASDGEVLVLYHWDGESDLVTDIDVLLWGGGASYRFSKTGVTIDGVDADAAASAYAAETAADAQAAIAFGTGAGQSYTRTDLAEGTQVATGGNGVGGRDETSENWGATFAAAAASPEPPATGGDTDAAKLLITELCITPSPGEFVEIHNPNEVDVDLSRYYLTDAIYTSGSQYYWRIVEGNPSQVTVGGGLYGDFHARFPDGATLKAGRTITVALTGSEGFYEYHGIDPDYELFEDGDPDGADDGIPELVEVFDGSTAIDNVDFGYLTNYNTGTGNGEVIVLYYWDGASDLVTDIDAIVWGNGSTYRFSKAGVSIDGPDEDATPSTYAAETAAGAIAFLTFEAGVGSSYTRVDFAEGAQHPTGGNGVGGRDELSEDWNNTFETAANSPDPRDPDDGGGDGDDGSTTTPVQLDVQAATFLPLRGEVFPVTIVAPRDHQTRLRLFDLQGSMVISLWDSTFDADSFSRHRVEWDGRNEAYEFVRAGVYVLHLSVVDPHSGEETVKTAPVVVATRLQK